MDQQGCRRLRNAEGEQLWYQLGHEVQGQQMRVQGRDEQDQLEYDYPHGKHEYSGDDVSRDVSY